MSAVTISILTPAGRGAVAVIAVRGAKAEEIVRRRFHGQAKTWTAGGIYFGRFRNVDESEEELVVAFRTPTDVEVHCHGGSAAVEAVCRALVAEGAVRGEPAEEVDEFRAEARAALALATTERAARILLRQYHSRLRDEFVAIDAAEPGEAIRRLRALEQTWNFGRHLTTPYRIVLCGRPNAGKSSLLNALAGYERAIVFDQPGTTRDVVTVSTAFDGLAVELADTAGLRTSTDELEAAGVTRARDQIAAADLLLIVVDQSAGWSAAEEELLAHPHIIVANKCDLPAAANMPATALAISATTGVGLDMLKAKIVAALGPFPAPDAAMIFTPRQREEVRARLIHRGEQPLSPPRSLSPKVI